MDSDSSAKHTAPLAQTKQQAKMEARTEDQDLTEATGNSPHHHRTSLGRESPSAKKNDFPSYLLRVGAMRT
jgi:hypothetical protein